MTYFDKHICGLFQTRRHSLSHSNGNKDTLEKIMIHGRVLAYHLLMLTFTLKID